MRRSQVLVVAAALALSVLSACGSSNDAGKGDKSGTGGDPKVASLATGGATPTASPKTQRPRERLDTTPEEFEAMLAPYNKCIKEHGGLLREDRHADGAGPRPATEKEIKANEEANRICEPQYFPLPPWEKDPANPESRDFAREVVKCLKNKGVKYVEVGDNGLDIELGGEKNDSKSISRGLDLMPQCERQAAATLKK